MGNCQGPMGARKTKNDHFCYWFGSKFDTQKRFRIFYLKPEKLYRSSLNRHLKTNQSPKVREKFGRGLINAVLSTQAWVITSGIDLGIAKEVGDAVKAGFESSLFYHLLFDWLIENH